MVRVDAAVVGSGRLALLRWHLWECHVAGGFLRQHGKMLLCPGSPALPSGQQVQAHPGLGGSHKVVSKAAVTPKMCPHSTSQVTSHPKHCDLLGSNPAPDVNHMKNNCLGHCGHFPLLRGGGWIRSQVLARNRQRSHCDWPVWLQQTLVLPVQLSLCPGHTL